MSHLHLRRNFIFILRNLSFRQSGGFNAHFGKDRYCITFNQDSCFLGKLGNSFSTSLTTYSDFVTELPVENLKKMKLFDDTDEVVDNEINRIDARKEARKRKMKLAILTDPKTNNPIAFKLMTPDQFKIYTTRKTTKEFKIKTGCSDHDLQRTIDKIEKVLQKGHPITLKIGIKKYETVG